MSATEARLHRRRWWFTGGLGAGAVAGALVFGLAVAAPGARSSTSAATPRFVEETTTAGIRQVYGGDFTYFVGGGVAVFDCNADGRHDAYFAGGERPAGLYRNDSAVGGALRFAPVADPATAITSVVGAYPLDVEGDGLIDLAVLRVGENVLLRGLGGCRFERANERWSVDGGDSWTVAFSAAWESPSGLPTLAFGNYLSVREKPDGSRECVPSHLFRPRVDTRGYGPPTALTPGLCTLSILFHDWDHSGRHDLRMANDRHYYREGAGSEQLWRLDPGSPPRLYTEADGWQTLRIWGMGIAATDLTGDGRPEVFLTSQADNKLQSLAAGPGRPTYSDVAIRYGVTAHRPFMGDQKLPSTAWHAEFADVNNDGLQDLFIAKGNVEAQVDHAAEDPSNLLVRNRDGTYAERARQSGVVSLGKGRGAALADFNLDGLLDLVEVNRGENIRIWRNVGSGTAADPRPLGQWAAIRLRQPGSNADGIGSWLEVRIGTVTTWRQLTVGGGHAGGQLGWIHLGLGDADSAQVRVTWPDGVVGPWVRVEVGGFGVFERGQTGLTPWAPGRPLP